VGSARLTCGQPAGQATFTQVSPKREDLTSSARIFGFDFDYELQDQVTSQVI
jgi:hypothetical protein